MISTEVILERLEAVPSLPVVVAHLSRLLEDPGSSAGDIERIVGVDPALTANLLKLANSACFGLRGAVTSVRSAVTLVGTERIFELAIGAAFSRVVPHRLPGYELDSRGFWRHSVAVAVLTEQLGRAAGAEDPSGGFAAGLLHDLGKLVISDFLAQNSDEVCAYLYDRRRGLPFIDVEHTILGTHHGLAGERLADRWHLPPIFGAVARYHHAPSEAPPEARGVADLAHVADGVAHLLGYGADVGELARAMQSDSLERLRLDTRAVERATSLALEQIQQLEQLMLHADSGVTR